MASAVVASAQSVPSRGTDPDSIQMRITRARALAAAGNLPAARSELESLRNAATDESTREITLVLLVGIYFEQSDYIYAEKLLDEAFHARTPQNEAAARGYYLLAGRTIGGVRTQLDRYRLFGLDVADPALPPESDTHLDRLRKLIEHVVEQGRQLRDENPRDIDAAALLENATSARLLLARNEAERGQWQREVADVRQRLTGVERTAPSTTLAVTQKPAPAQSALGVTQAVPEPSPTRAAQNQGATQNTGTAPASQPTPQRAQQGAASTDAQPSAGQKSGAAPSATPGAASVEVGSLMAYASQTVAPSYPAAARTARIGGKVTIYLLVNEKGEVAAVQRSEGAEMLRRAAEDAARRWKFRPMIVNGQPARYTGFVNFNFAP
ncbi:MAG: TonB family protein [Pyrinomonadaceae bacterium]